MSAAAASNEDFVDVEPTAGEKLGAEIAELSAYIDAATSRFLELLREFDTQRYWEELGFTSCAHWLNFQCGLGMGAARERLRVAHALAGLPKTRAQFATGKLSYSKVRAITRVGDANNEDFLLMVARHGTAHHLDRLVTQYRRAKKLEDPEFVEDLYRQREATYYYDHDGCLVLKARMPAAQGELIIKALEMALESDGVPAGTSAEPEPIAARRADALAGIAETYMNNSENSGSTADRYQVVIHKTAGAAPGRDHLDNGPGVPAETSRRVSCDCSTYTVTEDDDGEPLNIGRKSRTIPPAIRRALRARDGGCRFPGCTQHRFVDGHHIIHWADGGETSLDNLVLLCRHHHRLVHEGGFACKKSQDGEIYFEDQRGQRMQEYAKQAGVTLEETLAWLYRRFAGADIDSESCSARWYAGETMDYEHAVSMMFAS